MPANAQWSAFMDLLDIDAAKSTALGTTARTLKQTLADYMTARFEFANPDWLWDIVSHPDVVSAVVTSLGHESSDHEAIITAVNTATAG